MVSKKHERRRNQQVTPVIIEPLRRDVNNELLTIKSHDSENIGTIPVSEQRSMGPNNKSQLKLYLHSPVLHVYQKMELVKRTLEGVILQAVSYLGVVSQR